MTQAAIADSAEANSKKPVNLDLVIIILTVLSVVGLYFLTSQGYYLLFHTIAELFSICIAFTIFAIAWNTRHKADNRYFLFIGVAFVFVAGLALFHTLAYKGMGVFPNTDDPNLATQLWLATRYLLSVSLLLPLLATKRRFNINLVAVGYFVVTALLLASIFVWQNFPLAYDNNPSAPGLTTFKVASEYVISLIVVLGMGLLFKKRRDFNPNIYKLILAAMALVVASEMAFTLYTDVYGIANIIGHLLNILSFYLIYRALVETNLKQPYELLFRDLKQSQTTLANRAEELTQVNRQLAEEITQRKGIEEALRQSEERLQLKLDSVLSPDVEIQEQELNNIIDVPTLQATMDHLYDVTKMGFALIDLKGKVLVGTGWQDICVKFHRVNRETCRNCVESDIELSSGLKRGEVRLYKCKNHMWDVVTPLFIGDKQVGNVFFGQFFFDDEIPNRDLFIAQAEKYGFNKKDYLAAFDRIPRFSRKTIEDLMTFYSHFSEMVSKISHANLKLAKSLETQKRLQEELEEKASEVQEYATQMEQLAEERARKLQDAERLSAIGATAGMVGHDIRNPLQAMINELYLEKKEINRLTEERAKANLMESVKSIEENLSYINKIVADLQDFAKPLNPKKEQVDLAKAIQESITMVTIPENIEFTIITSQNLPPFLGDPTMIKRVLVNLAQNAVQAMPKGGNLTIQASSTRRQIQIVVQDTGEGIPKDVQAKLFTPLMTTKAKGQGFGLPVVKRMTEAMNGTVTFESQEGEGTKFILTFPAGTR